jgi:replicative DNA helicase
MDQVYTIDIDLELLNTNINKIDSGKNKFQYRELILVASRPSMGVTSFLVQLGMEFSKFHNVTYLTNKDNFNLIGSRIEQYSNNFNDKVVNPTIEIIQSLAVSKDLKSKLNRMHNTIVIIDNFESFDKVLPLKYLKNIADTNKLLIVLGSSLKRSVEKRYRSIPTCDDLPFSNYKQSFVDKIILLRRPFYYNLKADKKNISLTFVRNKFKNIIKCRLANSDFQKIDF